jgi:hypothetical protein
VCLRDDTERSVPLKVYYSVSQKQGVHHVNTGPHGEAPGWIRRQKEPEKVMSESHFYYSSGKLLGRDTSYWIESKTQMLGSAGKGL